MIDRFLRWLDRYGAAHSYARAYLGRNRLTAIPFAWRNARKVGAAARVFVTRRQIAVRIGRHFLGVRSRTFREYYSERNRLGWHVVYLPLGWRVFHRKAAR